MSRASSAGHGLAGCRRPVAIALVLVATAAGSPGCTDRPAADREGGGTGTAGSPGSTATDPSGLDATHTVPADSTATEDGTGGDTGEPPPVCVRLVDDLEDGDHFIDDARGQPQGLWYAWSVSGLDSGFALVDGPGALDSQAAVGTRAGYLVADLANPRCPGPTCPESTRGSFDASRFQGVSFWTRVDEPVMLADVNLCAGCNGERQACTSMAGAVFVPTTQWQQIWVDFSAVPSQGCAFDPGDLTGIIWSEHPDSQALLWIDQLCFY